MLSQRPSIRRHNHDTCPRIGAMTPGSSPACAQPPPCERQAPTGPAGIFSRWSMPRVGLRSPSSATPQIHGGAWAWYGPVVPIRSAEVVVFKSGERVLVRFLGFREGCAT